MRRGALVLTTAAVLAFGGSGIRPRGDSKDYSAHASAGSAAVGAAIVPPREVRNLFATDLKRFGYVVVEVAVYPAAGRQVKVVQDDFVLQGGSSVSRTTSAETVASVATDRKTPPPPSPMDAGNRNVTVTTTAEIGRESGIDPVTGRRQSGVYQGEGVGVGVGDPGPQAAPPVPAPTGPDRYTLERELTEKSLPEGETGQAVAGYLYFPRPSKARKNEPLELTWYAPGGNVRLSLAPGK